MASDLNGGFFLWIWEKGYRVSHSWSSYIKTLSGLFNLPYDNDELHRFGSDPVLVNKILNFDKNSKHFT